MKKYKQILALATSAAMIVGCGVPAFAAGVTGDGAVEYDDSKAVVYDSVTLPTLTAATYNFTIDPTGLLNEFDADNYGSGSVYFTSGSISTYESLVPKAGVKLYEKTKSVVDAVDGKWADIVKDAETDDETKAITVSDLEEGYFVWVPKAFTEADSKNGITAVGKKGDYLELTNENFSKWFDVSEPSEGNYVLSLKNNYKSGTDICSGVVYKTDYAEIPAAGIVEAVASDVSVEKYATISNGAVEAYTNVYEKSGTGTDDDPIVYTILDADSEDMVYTAQEITKNANSSSVDITNKSTREKTVTAVITMANAGDLTFKATNSYENNEAVKSVYFAAMGGTAAVPFVKAEDGTVSATFETTIAGKTGAEDIIYQTSAINAAGGHVYARYEAPDITYTTKGFYLTASANTKAEAKTAWEEWAAGITADTKPSINIVYTVKNTPTEEENAAAAEAELTAAINAFKTTHATILAKTAETIAYEDLDAVNAALTAYAALEADVKAGLATEKELLDALKTAAEAKSGPTITMTEDGLITMSRMTADKNFKNLTIGSGTDLNNVADGSYTQNKDNWSQTEGGTLIVQLGNDFMSYYGGKSTTATLILSDDTEVSVTTVLSTQ